MKLVPQGTPMMSFKLTIGRTSMAGRDLYTNEAIAAFYPDATKLDTRFLYYCLPRAAREVITDVAIKGATLNKKSLAGMRLPLPPIDEQRAIARTLDALGEQIESVRRVVRKLENLRLGQIDEYLGRDDIEATVPLGQIAEVSSGVTLGSEPGGPGTVVRPYLRVANVQDAYLDLDEIKFVRVRQTDLGRYALAPGDVLMNEGGDADKLGRGAVWSGEIPGCLHQNHVFRVRCFPSRLEPDYLSLVSGSTIGKRYFMSASKQTTNLASINSTQIKAFPVPMRSIDRQRRIVADLRNVSEMITGERATFAKLELLREGVEADLLAGRVRVPLGGMR